MVLLELLGMWLVLMWTGPVCLHANSMLISTSTFPTSQSIYRCLHCPSQGNCLAWPPQFKYWSSWLQLSFWVTCICILTQADQHKVYKTHGIKYNTNIMILCTQSNKCHTDVLSLALQVWHSSLGYREPFSDSHLSSFGHRSCGSASLPDYHENHLTWVDLSLVVPLEI
jgi:hypothetical protein